MDNVPGIKPREKCHEGSMLQPHSLPQDCCLSPGIPKARLDLSDGNSG